MRAYPALMLCKPFRQNEMDILAYLPFLCFRNGQFHTGADGNTCDNLSLMPTQETGFLMIDFKLFLPNDLFNQRQYLLRRKDISRKGEIIRVASINQIIFSSQCRQLLSIS